MTFLMKLVGLPLIALLTLVEWLGIFALGISQFITNKLAALIFFIMMKFCKNKTLWRSRRRNVFKLAPELPRFSHEAVV